MNHRTLKSMIATCIMLVSAVTATAQTAEIEKAFVAISELPGFMTANRKQIVEDWEWDQNDPRISPELGEIKATVYGNADPRDQFLAILDKIPANLLYSETRDDRDKISRFYTETDVNGVGYLMYIFVGWGGNDTFAMLYKGCDEATYRRLVDEGK